MKTISELTDFYYKTLYPVLQKLEQERKALKSRVIIVAITYTIFALVLYAVLSGSMDQDFTLVYLFGYIAVGGIIYKFLIQDYKSRFKDKVMRPLISEIDSSLRYRPGEHLPQHHFEQSLLFQEPDIYTGNDFVQGKIDGINISFSDIHAQKEHKDSRGKKTHSTIFQGLFIVSEFHKNFKGFTVILPDTAQKLFGDYLGSFLQSNNLTRKGSLIKMDAPDFEKEFVVYGSDQIEARYILTPSLMEKLLTYKKRSKHPLHVSFHQNKIYMAIEYNKDLFEPSVFHSLLNYKIAMQYLQTLHLATGVVEELKLNQKLWSKI